MSILPSPPHPFTPEPAFPHHYHYRQVDPKMNAVLASSWRVLEQPPPPSLREILEAYKARGDGDREMLLAMLNAKSSEDQRLASIATLHRTMLDMYHAPHAQAAQPVIPLHVPDAHHSHPYSHAHHFPSPPASYHHSPHAHIPQQLHHDQPHTARRRTDSGSSVNDARDRPLASPSTSQQARKRRRISRSPPPYERRHGSSPQEPTSAHDLPLSPYSSASSAQSSGGSPRSRESMAINSLLLNSHGERADNTPKGNMSSERSTTSTSRDR